MGKLCECGCGQPTPMARHNNKSKGWVKGQPLRFAKGHKLSSKYASIDDAFWSNCLRGSETECWEWLGERQDKGYGRVRFQRTLYLAHRLSCQLHHGSIPDGMVIRHVCDNPGCVNPDHLIAGTAQQNSSDMVNRGRQAIGTKNASAKLTEADVLFIRKEIARGASPSAMASQFLVTSALVRMIVNRKIWKHLP